MEIFICPVLFSDKFIAAPLLVYVIPGDSILINYDVYVLHVQYIKLTPL